LTNCLIPLLQHRMELQPFLMDVCLIGGGLPPPESSTNGALTSGNLFWRIAVFTFSPQTSNYSSLTAASSHDFSSSPGRHREEFTPSLRAAAVYLLEGGDRSSAGDAAAEGESGGQRVHSCLIFPEASLLSTKQPNSSLADHIF